MGSLQASTEPKAMCCGTLRPSGNPLRCTHLSRRSRGMAPQLSGRSLCTVKAQASSGSSTDVGSMLRDIWNGMLGGSSAMPLAKAPRENAVLVVGAAGRVGKQIVQKIIESGRTVVAAVGPGQTAENVIPSNELNCLGSDCGTLIVESVDAGDKSTLTPELFEGVTQVVSAIASMEDPERVDAQGNVHLGEAAIEMLPHTATAAEEILNLQTQKDVEMWERLDDVIMGGKSSSSIKLAGDGSGAVWSGDLVVEGGGFCGCRISLPKSLDLSMFDGVQFTAKGNGSIFKLNLATAQSEGGKTYQASFETVEGAWTEVKLPWHEFVPVDQAMYEPGRPPADPSNVVGFTLVYSRFTHNRMPNPKYSPGPFEFEIKGGISVFRDPRPQIVLVSSGALERSALIGDDAAAREKEIPIVQMNPKGLLDWKYAGENAIRATGLPYTVVRPCGLKDDGEMVPNLIEGDQGDQFRGTLTFGDVADVVVRVLDSPAAAYKTFEIRRSNDPLLEGRTMSDADYRRMFLKLALDRHRPRVGLPPFPPPYMSSPPAPTDSELEQTAKGQDNVADTEGQGEDSVTKVSETANATS